MDQELRLQGREAAKCLKEAAMALRCRPEQVQVKVTQLIKSIEAKKAMLKKLTKG